MPSLRGRHRHFSGFRGETPEEGFIEHDHDDELMIDDHNHFAYTYDINHRVVTLMFGPAVYDA